MTVCPKCGSIELIVFGPRVHVWWAPRWRFFGRTVARTRVVGLNVACSNCNYSMVARETGTSEAPQQKAYDDLRAVQKAVAEHAALGTGRSSPEGDKPETVPNVARPASDPRVRRRNR